MSPPSGRDSDRCFTVTGHGRPCPISLGEIRPNDRDSDYGRDMAAQFGPYQRSFCNKCRPRD